LDQHQTRVTFSGGQRSLNRLIHIPAGNCSQHVQGRLRQLRIVVGSRFQEHRQARGVAQLPQGDHRRAAHGFRAAPGGSQHRGQRRRIAAIGQYQQQERLSLERHLRQFVCECLGDFPAG
jgi:hypothetical protein